MLLCVFYWTWKKSPGLCRRAVRGKAKADFTPRTRGDLEEGPRREKEPFLKNRKDEPQTKRRYVKPQEPVAAQTSNGPRKQSKAKNNFLSTTKTKISKLSIQDGSFGNVSSAPKTGSGSPAQTTTSKRSQTQKRKHSSPREGRDLLVENKRDPKDGRSGSKKRKAEDASEKLHDNLMDTGFVSKQIAFRNCSGAPVELVYKTEPTEDDVSFGILEDSKVMCFNSYIGHTWYSRDPETKKSIQTIVVVNTSNTYDFLPAHRLVSNKRKRKKDKIKFEQEYLAKTGRPWINVYPRETRVSYHMYVPRTTGVGYQITSSAVHIPPIGNNPTSEEVAEWQQKMEETPDLVLNLATKSLSPRVFLVKDFASRFECEAIMSLAATQLEPSLVTDKGNVTKEIRHSSTAWLKRDQSTVVQQILDRVADLCQMDRAATHHNRSAEFIQVVRYKPHQFYNEHVDYLAPSFYPDCPEVQRGNNRFCTVLVYLKSPKGPGGHTHFPYAKNHQVADGFPGSDGLKLRPKDGSAIMFYSMLPDGNLDEKSLHAGLPVVRGEKWIANIFLWDPVWK